MSIAHLLEDFSVHTGAGLVHCLDDAALEEQRLAAFEQGYGAGWEDAISAQEQSQGQISTELAGTFADLSFTYHEALNRMSLSLEPMFESLVQTVLPDILDRGFATRLSEQLRDLALEQAGQPMVLSVAQGFAEQVSSALPADLSPSPKVVEDPDLSKGQAVLQVGISRRKVDCDAVLQAIAEALDAYIFEANRAVTNE